MPKKSASHRHLTDVSKLLRTTKAGEIMALSYRAKRWIRSTVITPDFTWGAWARRSMRKRAQSGPPRRAQRPRCRAPAFGVARQSYPDHPARRVCGHFGRCPRSVENRWRVKSRVPPLCEHGDRGFPVPVFLSLECGSRNTPSSRSCGAKSRDLGWNR